MKPLALLLPTLCLAACAAQHSSIEKPAVTVKTADEGLPGSDDIREPSHVHTYIVNDYVDPNNPRVRHRGHSVDVVEQDEKWNLNSTDSTDGNYGPVTAADDPNAAPNPYSAEFETELTQQRDQYRQLVDLGTQMTAEMEKLQQMAEKDADAVSENAALRNRLDAQQQEIEALKPPSAAAVAANAPKKSSSFHSIWDFWFRQAPQGTPVVENKPDLQTKVVLRPAEPSSPAPDIFTTPPVAPTNAPPLDPSLPSPGEMAQPGNNSPSQP